jgi:hypothetical protein
VLLLSARFELFSPQTQRNKVHCFHGLSDCPYCLKVDMDISTGSLSFLDYLVMDFGIHILFENIYGMRMTDLSIFEVLCETTNYSLRVLMFK